MNSTSSMRRLLIALPLATIGALWFVWLTLPWPILLRWRDPHSTSFMEMRIDEARDRDETIEIRQTWVPLDRISRNLQRAVILAEDGRFLEHGGIDWIALGEELDYDFDDSFSLLDPHDVRATFNAVVYFVRHRDEVRGRSTLTQQLAKNLYFSDSRSMLRKLEELVVAVRLERFLAKDRILEVYLNIAEWGPGVFGAEAAARHYFNRSAADLTVDQAATLAATLPHPLSSNPRHRPGRMLWRKNLILQRIRATSS